MMVAVIAPVLKPVVQNCEGQRWKTLI